MEIDISELGHIVIVNTGNETIIYINGEKYLTLGEDETWSLQTWFWNRCLDDSILTNQKSMV